MSQETERFVDQLVAAFPGMRPVFDEHLAANFGEVLPHVFFGELTAYILDLAARSGPDPEGSDESRELHAILSAIEDAHASGPDEVQELVAVSFLENLPRPGETGSEIRNLVGPTLSEQLRVIG